MFSAGCQARVAAVVAAVFAVEAGAAEAVPERQSSIRSSTRNPVTQE
jgi:hypothetical protein